MLKGKELAWRKAKGQNREDCPRRGEPMYNRTAQRNKQPDKISGEGKVEELTLARAWLRGGVGGASLARSRDPGHSLMDLVMPTGSRKGFFLEK